MLYKMIIEHMNVYLREYPTSAQDTVTNKYSTHTHTHIDTHTYAHTHTQIIDLTDEFTSGALILNIDKYQIHVNIYIFKCSYVCICTYTHMCV